MLGRRGVIGLLLGAPAVAQKALSSTLDDYERLEPTVSSGSAGIKSDREIDGEREASTKRWRTIEDAMDRKFRNGAVYDMPVWVKTKKSWSKAFKHHVAYESLRERDRLDTDIRRALETRHPGDRVIAITRIARRLGISPTKLL